MSQLTEMYGHMEKQEMEMKWKLDRKLEMETGNEIGNATS